MSSGLYIIYNANRSTRQYSVHKQHVSIYLTVNITFWCYQIQQINSLQVITMDSGESNIKKTSQCFISSLLAIQNITLNWLFINLFVGLHLGNHFTLNTKKNFNIMLIYKNFTSATFQICMWSISFFNHSKSKYNWWQMVKYNCPSNAILIKTIHMMQFDYTLLFVRPTTKFNYSWTYHNPPHTHGYIHKYIYNL